MKKNFKVLSALFLVVVLAATFVAPVAAAPSGSFMCLLLKQNIRYYDGDVFVARERIVRGEVMEPLALEEKDGLVLEGWYTDEELTEKFDFTKPIETGVVLYAKWVEASEVVVPEDTTEEEVTEEPAEETEDTTEAEDTTEVTE